MIRVDASDLSRFVADIRAMKKRTADVSSATKEGAGELQKVLDATFAASRSPDGTPWAGLKPSTIARKKSAKPLVETGALRASRKAKATKKGVAVEVTGSRAQVARILSSGTRWSPARPVLPRFAKSGPAYAALQQTLARIARFVLRGNRR